LSGTQRELSLIIQAFRHSALGKLYSLAAIESLQQRDGGGAAICFASSVIVVNSAALSKNES
jgi:hypothetical protein